MCEYSWNYKKNGVGTSISDDEDYDWGSNDWSDSQLMMMLNPTNYLKSGYTNFNDIISNGQEIKLVLIIMEPKDADLPKLLAVPHLIVPK